MHEKDPSLSEKRQHPILSRIRPIFEDVEPVLEYSSSSECLRQLKSMLFLVIYIIGGLHIRVTHLVMNLHTLYLPTLHAYAYENESPLCVQVQDRVTHSNVGPSLSNTFESFLPKFNFDTIVQLSNSNVQMDCL